MHRVLCVLGGGLLLAACSSSQSWLDSLKPEPLNDTVRFESEPPGADVAVGTQTCKTPCSLNIPTNAAATATFSLSGYQPDTEQLDLVSAGDGSNKFNPNPVVAELTAAVPPKKPPAKKKSRKPAAKKPAPKPAASSAAPAPATAPAPTAAEPEPAEPPPNSTASPWPASPAPKQQ